MKYKVGDKVVVRKDLNKKIECMFGVISEMLPMRGQTVTILSVFDCGYRISESGYSWSDEMFEGLAFPEKWAIESCLEVGKWLNENSDLPISKRANYANTGWKYLHYPAVENQSHIYDRVIKGYTEITIEQFREHYLSVPPLPEKWYIKIDISNLGMIGAYRLPEYGTPIDWYLTNENSITWPKGWLNCGIPSGYEHITNEQFRKYIYEPSLIDNEPMKESTKKIIGYKCPTNMYGNAIKSGTLYIELKSNTHLYEPTETPVKTTGFYIPKEIAETWEPVYQEESKSYSFGNVQFTVKQGDDFATTSYGRIPKSEIKKMLDYIDSPPTLIGYGLNLNGRTSYSSLFENTDFVTIGCEKGSVGELREIYKLFDK